MIFHKKQQSREMNCYISHTLTCSNQLVGECWRMHTYIHNKHLHFNINCW